MHQLCTLLLLTLALTAPDAVNTGLIFGGKEAVPHSRPYMVLVESGNTLHCGGFLLSENFVMTAAHCKASSYKIVLGLHDYFQREGTQTIAVKEAFIREDYDPETLLNDLLLLKLSDDAKLTPHVKTIAVAGPDDAEPHSCSVAGWGRSEKHPTNMTPVLMEVNATLSTDNDDEDFYYYIGKKEIGMGDSGGPLVCEDEKVYGLVSGVLKMDEFQFEHLFSKIPKHKEWIDSIMATGSQNTGI